MSVQSVGFRGATPSQIRYIDDGNKPGNGSTQEVYSSAMPSGRWLINYSGYAQFPNASAVSIAFSLLFKIGSDIQGESDFAYTNNDTIPLNASVPFSLMIIAQVPDGNPSNYILQIQETAQTTGNVNYSLTNQSLSFIQI